MEKIDICDLVALVRDGDNLAFAELIKRYTPLINKEIGDCADSGLSVGELYAEACIGLHRAAVTYDTSKTLTFGLYAKICIYRRLIDLRRANNVPRSDVDVDKLYVTPSIDSRLAEAERFDLLMSRSKELLSDFEYQIFVLHVQGYRTARIGEILSVTPKSVDNAKNRLFRKLREYFSNYSDD
jgi:RNA polymerase sporulation-specific sigma factor